MKSFLEYVAEDILGKYGTNLSRVAVVFPNKRASLFLNEHLARLAGRPIWSPAYITISDLFRRHSSLQVADPIKLVCDLYRVFIEVTGTDETLDHFYGWGQLLLADFDDLDKNMADAEQVFRNLRDLHELDAADYLTDEQKKVIRKFFSNFSDDHTTELKERFLRLWSRMGQIYTAFNEHLEAQGLAYEGALYRKVACSSDIDFSYDTYLFVGFNLLQQVEQRLFSTLRKQGRAHFYWDFDHYYMHDNEAGYYIAQYQVQFPNELDADNNDIYGQFAREKRITFVSATTENIQARYISTWLQQERRFEKGRQTAIVLCNEALLPTAIHSLPDEVSKVNITTGYPLAQSPVASFIRLLITMQTVGYVPNRDQFRLHHVNGVLRHPYTSYIINKATDIYEDLNSRHVYFPDRTMLACDESTALLFEQPSTRNADLLSWLCRLLQAAAQGVHTQDPLFQESIFRAYGLVNRLKALVECGDLQVDMVTLQRLLGQMISQTSIPFHGEPAEGIQVMGVLETRNLDFGHLLILSCNDGNMPKGVNDNSFIPYNIRKAYGLTTIDHKVSIYSYYFHRLLQRAKDVTILYNNATTDGQTGEMSRFMLQLMVEGKHPISFKTLQAGQHLSIFAPPTIEKTEPVMEALQRHFATSYNPDADKRPLLTPTAMNRYMRCPLQFYYKYVCNLEEPDETDDDSIDNRIFGNIFHEAVLLLYKQLMDRNRRITADEIGHLLRNRVDVERCVDEALRTQLFKTATMMPLNGLQIISREVIIHYLRLLLQQDRLLAPFTIVGLECDVVVPMKLSAGSETFVTSIGGRIDRLDQIMDSGTERLRVIDYKTGNSRPTPLADVEAIFSQENLARHSDYYLQTFLYSCLVRKSQQYNPQQLPVSPALLFIQHSADDPVLAFGKERINDVADYSHQFAVLIKEKAEEMFNPAIPFTPTPDRTRCRNCIYRELCRGCLMLK